MSNVLSNVKVLDLSRVLAGPYCTMILGDLGAEITKVEAPGGSDDTRKWGPPYVGGESAYYLGVNRNKRALTVNFKTAEGREILRKLAAQADVLIQNYKTGTLERLGLGYEQVREIHPRIIYCSITGFGQTGPYRDMPGYDYIIQAMSGLMSITGSKESGPMKVGVPIADVLTGLYAAVGIIGALYEREHSGQGQSIDLALFDAQLSALVNVGSNYLISREVPERVGSQHPNIVPYQTFATADGELVLAVGNDRQFSKVCELLNLPKLAGDPRFMTNSKRIEHKEELLPILANKLKQKTGEEWMHLFSSQGVPCGPINNLEQVFNDPQTKQRDMEVTFQHPTAGIISTVGSPLKFSRTKVSYTRYPPLAGEHSADILAELGYSPTEINRLRQAQII